MVILERRPYIIGYAREEEPFYWVNFGGGCLSFFILSKTVLEVGWSFILWSMLNLEGWSSR